MEDNRHREKLNRGDVFAHSVIVTETVICNSHLSRGQHGNHGDSPLYPLNPTRQEYQQEVGLQQSKWGNQSLYHGLLGQVIIGLNDLGLVTAWPNYSSSNNWIGDMSISAKT